MKESKMLRCGDHLQTQIDRKENRRHEKGAAIREAFSFLNCAGELLHLHAGVRPLFEVRKIRAHTDWLIRRDSHAERNVGYWVSGGVGRQPVLKPSGSRG
jgi:hypothetical protein